MLRFAFPLILAAAAAPAETLTERYGAAETRITLSEDLGAHPGFARFLREEALAIREDFRLAAEGGALTVEDQTTLSTAAFASVLRQVSLTEDGRESLTVEALTWGGPEGFARLDAFFMPGEALDEALIALSYRIRRGLQEDVWRRPVPSEWRRRILQATNPDVAVLANFTLAAGDAPGRAAGISFHFNPGEVAPGPDPVTLNLPWRLVSTWLSREGQALFGGDLRR